MKRAFVGRLRGEASREASASGGAFYALASSLVQSGWKICGAVWDDDFKGAHHEIVDTLEGVERLRGSKYVASRMHLVLKHVKDLLCAGESVFFCGCPCQVAALLKFVGGAREGLLTCELICAGVPESILLKRCIEDLERRKHRAVSDLVMRRRDGGRPFVFKYRLNGESRYRVERWLNRAYVRLWMIGYAKRASCFNCQFKECSGADFTIGDAWGLKSSWGDDGCGLSVVIANSVAALNQLHRLSDFISNEVDYRDVVRGNPALVSSRGLSQKDVLQRERLLDVLNRGENWKPLAAKILDLGFGATALRYLRRLF